MMNKVNKKWLIINADDFNLTPGVSEGILECVRCGVVTSTSVLVAGGHKQSFKKLKKYPYLGVGLHVTITRGTPLAPRSAIKSLVTKTGTFFSRCDIDFNHLVYEDLLCECKAQFKQFRTIFSKLPTHIDTHHHVHKRDMIFEVLKSIALRYHIPVRGQKINNKRCCVVSKQNARATHFCYGRFNPKKPWTKTSLINIVRNLKNGITELIVHPGYADAELKRTSSFTTGREQELQALCSDEFKQTLQKEGIRLISFGDIQCTENMV
jgi:chitin disaccharide deacetylase